MNPIVMTVLLVTTLSALIYSLNRRIQLMKVARAEEHRLDQIPKRLAMTLKYAFGQWRMPYYPLAGVAHILIFFGFLVLLARSIVLWGRGYDPGFNLWVLGPEPVLGIPLGHLYELSKELAAFVVIVGVALFAYLRLVVKAKRMSLHWEGLLILGIIFVMMVADLLYDGAALALRQNMATIGCTSATVSQTCASAQTIIEPYGGVAGQPVQFAWFMPLGSPLGAALAGLSPSVLIVLAHAGFWTHATLVLLFANLLPYTKHFHIFTVMPNVFTAQLNARGRLKPLAATSEQLMEQVGEAAELEDPNEAPIGVARIEHLSWKSVLDFYTCTECGRCSDNCPAYTTGKVLSPKHLTLDLRNFMYQNEKMLLEGVRSEPHAHGHSSDGHAEQAAGHDGAHDGDAHAEPSYPDNPMPADAPPQYKPVDLVPNVIQPDVLWGCTTCMACEEFCPVLISYVDKIVGMRRHLVMIRGEFPPELAKPFEAMETNGNPWNLSRMDRAAWAEGLNVPTMADNATAEVLYWVGCAASYDDRAKKTARALVRLMQAAGVNFAILGEEETCSGDPARRAGNEYLYAMLAEQNVATINRYKEMGGVKTIVTACPHCFNTLGNEYKDFGGDYRVVHHSEFLIGLVRDGKLKPHKSIKEKIVFHDSCYLGRYNDVYDAPRDVLAAIPGVDLVEVERFRRNKGLCCGAGGAQMWMEEQNKDRMNVRRTLQLVQTNPQTIATACPFCMTMITDGLKDQSREDDIRQLDIAELLAQSCLSEAEDAPSEQPPADERTAAAG